MIDDSGDRKDCTATANVGRQWLGRLGKTDNRIVTVTTVWTDGVSTTRCTHSRTRPHITSLAAGPIPPPARNRRSPPLSRSRARRRTSTAGRWSPTAPTCVSDDWYRALREAGLPSSWRSSRTVAPGPGKAVRRERLQVGRSGRGEGTAIGRLGGADGRPYGATWFSVNTTRTRYGSVCPWCQLPCRQPRPPRTPFAPQPGQQSSWQSRGHGVTSGPRAPKPSRQCWWNAPVLSVRALQWRHDQGEQPIGSCPAPAANRRASAASYRVAARGPDSAGSREPLGGRDQSRCDQPDCPGCCGSPPVRGDLFPPGSRRAVQPPKRT